VDFAGLDLNGTDFRNANLTDANFTGALLWRTNWGGATLTRTNFDACGDCGCDHDGCRFAHGDSWGPYPAAGFARTNMRNVNLQGMVSTASFGYVDLTGADLQDGIFDYVRYYQHEWCQHRRMRRFMRMEYLSSFTWAGDDLSPTAATAMPTVVRVSGI
jgi:uncharacterized protein YjbI with pentapeptide repeats